MDNNSVIMQWNLDEHGNPTSRRIDREVQQVSTTHNLIQLVQIPDSSQRIIILMVDPKNNTQRELQEVLNRKDLDDGSFYVEYGMGLVLFSERWQGCTAYISYYGRGIMLISDSRVFHKNGSTFYDTYDNIIERGLDAIRVLDAAGGLQGAIDRLQQLGDEGNAIADRLQEFITETQFYGYTIVLTREAFVVKSDNDGTVESNEINGCYTDVIAYQGAKQVAPRLSVGTCEGCEVVVVDNYQRFKLKSLERNIIKAQANVYLDFGDNLIAQRTLEFTKVFDGVDPYQVEMTNPFLAIETSQDGNILNNQEVECEVVVTKAGEPIEINSYTVEVQNAPLNLYHEVNENKVKFSVRSGSNFPSGTCLVVVKIGKQTFNKTFAWSMVKSGHDAKSLVVVGNQILRYQEPDYSDIPTPSRCVVTAQVNGLSGTPRWYRMTLNEQWELLEGHNSTTLSFDHDDFTIWGNRTEITVKCELDGYSDELTIVKLTNGASGENAITIFLTNESITIPMDENGEISEYDIQKCYTKVKVYSGWEELVPNISVVNNENCQVRVDGDTVYLVDIDRSGSTVDIELLINVNGMVYTKVWSIAKARQGLKGNDGENGSTYSIVVEGGTTTITYAQINTMPRPSISEPFVAYLYKDGQLYEGLVSWYWSAMGNVSGTGLHKSFTPTISSHFDEALLNNSVTVSATCEGARVSTIIPISITKDAAGLDWVSEWDGTKTEINDTTVLTPKLFAGIVEPNEVTGDSAISGVAVGADVLNNGTNVGIVGYQQDKVSFLLDVDGTLQIGNFYEPDGVGIRYDKGKLDIKVSELSITGSEVVTKDDLQDSVNEAMNSAKSELELELSEVMSSLTDMESYLAGAFQDGILSEVEKGKFEALYTNLQQETNDVTGMYLSIMSNEYFINEELRTLLSDTYTAYITAFDSITMAYHEIMAGGLDIYKEETDEVGDIVVRVEALEHFNESLASFRSTSEQLSQYLNDALLNISESQSASMIAAARLEITQEIEDVAGALEDLDVVMNNEFKTGLITYINQQNLDAKLNQLELEKIDIDAQYQALYSSKALPTPMKAELAQCKAEFNAIHDILVADINAAITDSLMTETELNRINSLIDEYAVHLETYSKKAQACNVAIAQAAVDSITQEDVFNILTNNGEVQGMFMKDKQMYINGEYVNTRNLVAVTDENIETFKVDEHGNVHITAKTFTLASDASTNLSEFLNLDDVDFDQETIFNALTNGGTSQGIYMVNGQIYINGQYINAKGLSVTDKSGTKTFEIDANGNVNIVANSFSVASGGSVDGIATKSELNNVLADAKQYADAAVNGVVTGAVNILMSNPVQVVATNVSFYPLSAETYTTTFQVFQGATEIKNYTINKVSSNHGFTVSQTSNSISFTTSQTTKISESGSFDISIVVDGITYKQTFSFTAARQGETGAGGTSCSVKVVASSNIFKSPDGGLQFTPDNITLKPILQNLTYSAWQYSVDGGATWNGFSNSITGWSVSNQVLTINKSCSLFTDTVTSVTIKLVTTDDTYYDIVTIVRLYDVADLQIGGTNLIPNSNFSDVENSFNHWDTHSTFTYNSGGWITYNQTNLTSDTWYQLPCEPIFVDYSVKQLTFSFDVRVEDKSILTDRIANIRCYGNTTDTSESTSLKYANIYLPNDYVNETWVRVATTLNDIPSPCYIRVAPQVRRNGTVCWKNLKLEKGSIATDWSPCPQDSLTSSQVNSLIKQTKDSIELSVSSKYTTKEAFDNLSIGGRNLAQKTSNIWEEHTTNFNGGTNQTLYNKTVLTDGLAIGDTVTYSIDLELEAMQAASGKTATVRLQGSGSTTSWSSGSFYGSNYTIPTGNSVMTITGNFKIYSDHLQNEHWKTSLRADNIQSGKIRIRNYKFEKGTIPTAWTPAPEDVDTLIDDARTSAIDQAVTTAANSVDSKLKSYSTTVDMYAAIKNSGNEITSTVSKTYETQTNATAKYNGFTTSINSLTTRMNAAEQKITDDSIISTVSGVYATKAEIENIQVGGTNRMINSAPTSTTGWSIHTTGWTRSLVDCETAPGGKAIRAALGETLSTGGIYKTTADTIETMENGEQYVLSCWIRASENVSIGVGHDKFTSTIGYVKDVTTEWQHVYTIGTWNKNAAYSSATFYLRESKNSGFWFEVHSVKLEKGNKPTDWSPAPEDVRTDITSLTERVNTAEQKITDSAIISTVSSNFVTKTEFNNLHIGGANLIPNSDFSYGFSCWNGNTDKFTINSDNVLMYNITDLTEAKNYQIYTDPIDVSGLVGETLTLTFIYNVVDKSNQTNQIIGYIRFFDDSVKTSHADSILGTYLGYDYTSTRATLEYQVEVPTNAKYVRVGAYLNQNGYVYWDNFQLEVGNVVTAWKPSVYDAILHAEATTGLITDELDDLSQLVSAGNESDAITPQMKVKLSAEYNDAKSIFDNLTNMYNTVGVTDFVNLKDEMVSSHTKLEGAITSLQANMSEISSSGLSSILNKFTTFYQAADVLNQAIINAINGTTKDLSTQIEQLAEEVNIKVKSFNDKLGEIETRFIFDETGLSIKSTANAQKYIKLDNDSLDFMDNGKKVAEVTDQQLNITNAEITNEMKIGNMKIKPSGVGGVMFVFE